MSQASELACVTRRLLFPRTARGCCVT
jgi:hypothetical protein